MTDHATSAEHRLTTSACWGNVCSEMNQHSKTQPLALLASCRTTHGTHLGTVHTTHSKHYRLKHGQHRGHDSCPTGCCNFPLFTVDKKSCCEGSKENKVKAYLTASCEYAEMHHNYTQSKGSDNTDKFLATCSHDVWMTPQTKPQNIR